MQKSQWQEAITRLRLTGTGHHAWTQGNTRPVPSQQDTWWQATTHQTLGIIAEQNPHHGATLCDRVQRSASVPTWRAKQLVGRPVTAVPPRVTTCSAPPVCQRRARQAAGRPSTPSQHRVPVPRCSRLGVPTPPVLSLHAAN